MAKPELGTKRLCPSCGAKYYDLSRTPITCPTCGTIFEVVTSHRSSARAAVIPVVEEAETEIVAEIEPDDEVISLEEVEEDDAVPVGDPSVDEEDDAVIADADPLEIETEIEADEVVAPFLDEEEEEGDVAGLLDVDAEDEDEV